MDKQTNIAIIIVLILLISFNLVSAIIVNADYITIYPGEEGVVEVEVDNNENYDIEDVSVAVVLGTIGPNGEIISLPFSVIGNSEKDLDDLDEDDDDSIIFKIRADNDITPGSYNIPYVVSYLNIDTDDREQKEGTFGLRVSAKTDLDFSVETKNPITGENGKISLEVINKGFGDIKSASVQVFPSGYELISKDKIFIGTVKAEDSDLISFDVIFKTTNPTLSAKITYKDFDNKDQVKTISIPMTVYTREKALELGLIKNTNYIPYIVVAVLIVAWFVWRGIKKRNKRKNRV